MEYLYSIATRAKSGDEGARNENLLTGIFVWVIERYPRFLTKILEQSIFFGQTGQNKNSLLEIENNLQLYGTNCPLNGLTKLGYFDAIFKGEEVALGLENKVVEIGAPNSLSHEQIERYCKALNNNFSAKWLMLVITPDLEVNAKKELDSFGENFPGHVCWISWQKIWDFSKNIIDSNNIEDSKKLVINELMGAIELAKLKPFKGFTEQAISVMEKLTYLDEISEFLDSVKDLMENNSKIGMEKFGKPHREQNGHEYVARIWPEYIEKNSDGAIYYGIWFRLDQKKFSVYVEFRDWATKARQHWIKKNFSRCEAIKSKVERKWKVHDVFLEDNEDGYYLTVPLKHDFLKSGLLDFVRDGVISLRDDIINLMGLEKP